jgi:hypothetical protein
MLLRFSRREHGSESGTVTAELAIAMPTVALVMAITISGFGLQLERMKFVSVAASAARALGRGETQADVRARTGEVAPEASLEIEFLENHICAKVSKTIRLLGQDFEVSESQCSRKMGL